MNASICNHQKEPAAIPASRCSGPRMVHEGSIIPSGSPSEPPSDACPMEVVLPEPFRQDSQKGI